MGKRFFDTELFNKVWFSKLKPKYKSFWLYVLCNCDLAGIWESDFEASQFFIGDNITEKEILENFGKQLLKIDEKRYIIKDFVEFQNGINLNPKSPVHQKIINILEKYSLYDRVLNRVVYTHIVIVEEVVEEKVIVEEVVDVEVCPTFKEFWELYDKKTDKNKCENKWNNLKQLERESIINHLPDYIKSTPDKQYRKNPETYLNQRGWEHEVIFPAIFIPQSKIT